MILSVDKKSNIDVRTLDISGALFIDKCDLK